jgi:hypothetical protein
MYYYFYIFENEIPEFNEAVSPRDMHTLILWLLTDMGIMHNGITNSVFICCCVR